MREADTLTLEEAERFREDGLLKFVSFESVPADESLVNQYLQKRASALMADVVGVPFNIRDNYGFYRTNLAEVSRLPVPKLKRDDEEFDLAA